MTPVAANIVRPLGAPLVGSADPRDQGEAPLPEDHRLDVLIAWDLAQVSDFTAQATWIDEPASSSGLPCGRIRDLWRGQGEPYDQQVDRIVARHVAVARRPDVRSVRTILDCTGVGRAIVDMVSAAGVAPVGIVFTGMGSAPTRQDDPRREIWNVPKMEMLNTLRATLTDPRGEPTGEKRLSITGDLPLVPVLLQEVQNLEVTPLPSGRLRVEVPDWRVGQNDDVLFAVAMVAWYGVHRRLSRKAAPLVASPLLRRTHAAQRMF